MRQAIALVLAAALGGCTMPDTPPPEQILPIAAAEGSWRQPILVECLDRPTEPVLDILFGTCSAFGEPLLEADGAGNIWYSVTRGVGPAAPLWRSTDGGGTFQFHEPGGTAYLREVVGAEADIGIDGAGNMYFFDITGTNGWFSMFGSDGTHVHTTLLNWMPDHGVDRPWVRGGAEDGEVFIAFYGGGGTKFFRSTDGGRTFAPETERFFPCIFGYLGQGGGFDDLWLTAFCPGGDGFQVVAWMSSDGGATWGEQEGVTPLPLGSPTLPAAIAADEKGTAYTAFATGDGRLQLFARARDGTWSSVLDIAGAGHQYKPWINAGAAGEVAVAWYHTDAPDPEGPDAIWDVRVAIIHGADGPAPHGAVYSPDPVPVLEGAFGRYLGDFLQVEILPDGNVAVSYARWRDGGPLENVPAQVVPRELPAGMGHDLHCCTDSMFVRTDGLDLGKGYFLNGPGAV